MAPASASLLPAATSAAAKRPSPAVSDAEHPLPQDGGAPGKNGQQQQQQQQQLECPRCKSGNTKFCYYNNYSTTQPRHFCRACRRYWTHGGTLRNVPVGGACRRGGGAGSKRRRSGSPSAADPSHSSGSPSAEDPFRPDNMLPPATPPFFPFLSDGAVFLPHFDLGLGGCAAAPTGFPWTTAGSDLYDGLSAPWGGGADGTLATGGLTGAWDDFTAGLELTWPPPPPAAGN